MTACEIIKALESSYRKPSWVIFKELRCGTGFGKRSEQRIDFYALHCYPSQHNRRIAFEIKVSRQDFLHELESPLKRRGAILLSNQFYFVTPPGLVDAKEIPIECGLMEIAPQSDTPPDKTKCGSFWRKANNVRFSYWVREVIDAPVRESILPTWKFVASLARRINREEELQAMTTTIDTSVTTNV